MMIKYDINSLYPSVIICPYPLSWVLRETEEE
jgi:hypothetical protein